MAKWHKYRKLELQRKLEKMPRHPLDERTVYGENLDFQTLLPAVQHHFIRAAIDHSDARTMALENVSSSLISNEPLSEAQVWSRINRKSTDLKYSQGTIELIQSPVRARDHDLWLPDTLVNQVKGVLTGIFADKAGLSLTLAAFEPKNKLNKGLDSSWHVDTFTINVCMFGAPMQWDFINSEELEDSVHEESMIENCLGDVHVFNDNLIHRSSHKVPEKGCISFFVERPPYYYPLPP